MHRILGLDLSADSLRLVALESGFRGFTVVEAREVPLPDGGRPGERLRAALGLLGLSAADDVACVALPAAQVASHLFTLPFTDPRRIEQVLPAEVEGAIPFDLSEVVWDHAVLSQVEGKSQVAVAVVKKSVLRELLALLHEAGLEPKVVTFAPLALAALGERGLLASQTTGPKPPGAEGPGEAAGAQVAETVLLLEAGPDRANLALLVGDTVALARTLACPGSAQWGAAAQDPEALQRLLAPLVRDLRLTLRARSGVKGQASPSCVLLAGPLAALAGAPELLSSELGWPASRLTLGAGTPLPPGLDAAGAALALGLALRAQQPRGHLNFRKGEFASTKNLSQVRGQIGRLAAAAALLLALAVGLGIARASSLGQRAKDYDDALCVATKKVLGTCLSDYKMAVSQMSGGGSKAAGIPRASASDVLAELIGHLPEGAVPLLEDVEVTTGSVRLKGVAESYQQVDQIKDALKADKCFGEIKPPRVEKLKESQKVTFTIDFPYVCSGEAGGA